MQTNKKHQLFISTLEQVREILQPIISKELKPGTPATAFDGVNDIEGSLSHLFSGLTVQESSDEFLKSAISPSGSTSTPHPQEKYILEQEQNFDGVHFAIHCLFNDLDNIREFLGEVWEKYKAEKCDLVAASITTNAAIDFSKLLQDDFQQEFPQHADVEKIFDTLYLQQCLASGQDPHFKEQPSDDMNFNVYAEVESFMFPTFTILSSFIRALMSGHLPAYLPGQFGMYEPSSNRSLKSARDKFWEDKIVLLDTLPDFWVLAHPDNIPAQDNFIHAVRVLVRTNRMQLWLVFAAQVFLDIHHILRGRIEAGFEDLVKSASYVAPNVRRVLDSHDNVQVNTGSLSTNHVLLPILNRISTWVESDKVLALKKRLFSGHPAVSPQPFFLLKQHPLYCGLLSYTIKMAALDGASTLANTWGSILSCAHLYNAVRQEGFLTDVWWDMNFALCMQNTEEMFAGGFPRTCDDYFKQFYMAMGYSASGFAPNKWSIWPVESGSGPWFMDELAPVSRKFKAQFCYNERSDLIAAGLEAIIAKYGGIPDIDSSDDTSSGWISANTKRNTSTSVVLNTASEEPKSSKTRAAPKRSTKSVAAGVKPVKILNALRNAISSEAFELTFDYFHLHTSCWRLLRSVRRDLDSDLRDLYGTNYTVGGDQQLPWIVGYIFMAATRTSRLGNVVPSKKKPIITRILLAKAAESIKRMIHTSAHTYRIGMMQQVFGAEVYMEDILSKSAASAEGHHVNTK